MNARSGNPCGPDRTRMGGSPGAGRRTGGRPGPDDYGRAIVAGAKELLGSAGVDAAALDDLMRGTTVYSPFVEASLTHFRPFSMGAIRFSRFHTR